MPTSNRDGRLFQKPHTNFVYRNNLTSRGNYGVIGTGTAEGRRTLAADFPSAEFAKNIIVGGSAAAYPPDDFFPVNLDSIGFVNLPCRDYRLADSSPFKNAGTDAGTLGADLDTVTLAITGSRL